MAKTIKVSDEALNYGELWIIKLNVLPITFPTALNTDIIVHKKTIWNDVKLIMFSVTSKNVSKCLKKLYKNDFTRKMKDFVTFAKIAQ